MDPVCSQVSSQVRPKVRVAPRVSDGRSVFTESRFALRASSTIVVSFTNSTWGRPR